MKKLDKLNPIARKMANALFAAFPAFERRFKLTPKGDLIARIVAPKGSRAVGIQVCTIGGRDVWVQFGAANAFCYVESERELVEIVTGLMEERLRFAIKSRKGKWTSSCLLRGREKIKLKRGETGSVYSWTGKKDIQDA